MEPQVDPEIDEFLKVDAVNVTVISHVPRQLSGTVMPLTSVISRQIREERRTDGGEQHQTQAH